MACIAKVEPIEIPPVPNLMHIHIYQIRLHMLLYQIIGYCWYYKMVILPDTVITNSININNITALAMTVYLYKGTLKYGFYCKI